MDRITEREREIERVYVVKRHKEIRGCKRWNPNGKNRC